jgi:hypothetical protein
VNAAQIKAYVDENFPDEEIVLFDGLESAFMGIATRFEPMTYLQPGGGAEVKGGTHRHFAVYSYSKIMEGLLAEGLDEEQASEHISFNILGAYAGESTPAVLLDEHDDTGYL